MDDMQPPESAETQQGGRGVTPSQLRNHNERAILTKLREHGAMAGAELARVLNVSAQTASVITRSLEKEGLLQKGVPIKGKVGKPQVPVALHPNGSFALGLQIGRRGADLVLMDLAGNVRRQDHIGYQYPVPAMIESFVRAGIAASNDELGQAASAKIVGIGIATPFELWNWLGALGAPETEANRWKDYDFATEFARFTDLKVFVANDINMACNGELIFGAGRTHRDFIYFYIGAFIGGGICLNGQVFHGSRGNAGAVGSIPIGPVEDPEHQLIYHASLYKLEKALVARLGRPVNLRTETDHWTSAPDLVDSWLAETSQALAKSAVIVTAVLDIDTIIIDGGMPANFRARLIDMTRQEVQRVDRQGIYPFEFVEGALGRTAGALGAAFVPLMSAHFLEGSQLF